MDNSPPAGLFIEPLQWHNRENLINGPHIRHRLENGEIAENLIGQAVFQLFEDLVMALYSAFQPSEYAKADRIVKPFNNSTLFNRCVPPGKFMLCVPVDGLHIMKNFLYRIACIQSLD